MHHFNIEFDKKMAHLKIYRWRQWNHNLLESGIIQLLKLIQSYYLNSYEKYLIRNIHKDGSQLPYLVLKRHLDEYYHFLALCELQPFITMSEIYDTSDRDILGHMLKEEDDKYLQHYYTDHFNAINQQVSRGDRNRIRKEIVNILQANTIHNIDQLNQKVLDLLEKEDGSLLLSGANNENDDNDNDDDNDNSLLPKMLM